MTINLNIPLEILQEARLSLRRIADALDRAVPPIALPGEIQDDLERREKRGGLVEVTDRSLWAQERRDLLARVENSQPGIRDLSAAEIQELLDRLEERDQELAWTGKK